MRFNVVSQNLKHVTLVQDFKALICMNSQLPIFKLQSNKYYMLSMILTQLTKLIIFNILLQRYEKLCEFLIFLKKLLRHSIKIINLLNLNIEYLLYHFGCFKCTV